MKPLLDDFIAPPCHDDIKILYEDDSLLMINKPSGLLSLSGKNPLNFDSVHYRLKKIYPSATLVHRLDFGTSGIMLVALNKEVNANLTKQFQARTVQKSYIAFLDGQLENEEGVLEFPISKNKENFPLQKVCFLEGKTAITHYRVLEQFTSTNITKVEFIPVTGRTHQLRIHSHEIGHSILGCDLYASEKVFAMADRLMLHAFRIEFNHPVSGERMSFDAPQAPFSI